MSYLEDSRARAESGNFPHMVKAMPAADVGSTAPLGRERLLCRPVALVDQARNDPVRPAEGSKPMGHHVARTMADFASYSDEGYI
jgi:hypothetical protein